MNKSGLTLLLMKTVKVIDSCKTWEQCEVAEKYMKLALNQINTHYRNKFKISTMFKNVTEELGIVRELYEKISSKYTELQRQRIHKLYT